MNLTQNQATAALRRIPVVVTETDGVTPKTGITLSGGDLKISKNGDAEANHGGSWNEIGGGDYYYEATQAELDTLGFFLLRWNKAGSKMLPTTASVTAGVTIATGGIVAGSITDGALTSAKFADGFLTAAKIASDAITAIQNGLATATSITALSNKIGAFAGSGANTILGFFQALMRKDVSAPSDVGGAYDPALESNEAIGDKTALSSDIATLLSRLSATRAGYLDELGPLNMPADLDTLIARLTSARAGYLDELAAANLPADIDSLNSKLTSQRATNLDELGAANIPADIDTMLARWTAARAGYLDNANVGGLLASAAGLTAITQSQRVRIVIPDWVERPDSGSTAYRIFIFVYNEQHTAEDLDSLPTVTAANNAGTDRSGNLGSVTKPGGTTGEYYVDYTVADSHALEQLSFKVAATENSVTTNYPASTLVVDTTFADYTSTDRARDDAMATKVDTLHDSRLTSQRATNLDELGAANLPADIDTLNSKLSAARAGYLDELAAANLPTDIDSLNAKLTSDRAGYLDELAAANMPADLDTLKDRLTSGRASNLDNLDATITSRATPAQVGSQLTAIGLDHLLSVSVDAVDVANGSIFARLVSKAATPAWSTYNNEAESLEAIGDKVALQTSMSSVVSDLAAVKTKTDLMVFTGNDLRVTLDSETVLLNNTSFAAVTVDGVAYLVHCSLSGAALFGEATISGSDATFMARDGSTPLLTLTYGATNGERTASVIE